MKRRLRLFVLGCFTEENVGAEIDVGVIKIYAVADAFQSHVASEYLFGTQRPPVCGFMSAWLTQDSLLDVFVDNGIQFFHEIVDVMEWVLCAWFCYYVFLVHFGLG